MKGRNGGELKPQNERSPEERKKVAAMGGKASVEARRKNKLLRAILEDELNAKVPNGNSTKAEVIISRIVKNTADKGDVRDLRVLFELMGELKTNVELSGAAFNISVNDEEEKAQIQKLLNRE